MGDWFTWITESAAWLQTLPWLLLTLILLPLAVLAWTRQIYPHVPLVILLLAPAILSLGMLWYPDLILLVATIDVVIVTVALADLLSLPGRRSLDAERNTLRIVSVQQRHPVALTITNRSSRTWNIWIRDDLPREIAAEPEGLARRVPPRSRSKS